MHKRISVWTVDTALRRIGREQGQAGLTRFVKWYKQLRALPRQFRRQLQRKWACSLAGVALMLTLQPASSWAANFNAGNAAQLIAAIDSANGTAAAPVSITSTRQERSVILVRERAILMTRAVVRVKRVRKCLPPRARLAVAAMSAAMRSTPATVAARA